MPTEVLNQLRVLRENIAETLRNDPRYLTLAALDKTIAEISGVLGAAGIAPPPAPAAAAPLHFETPAAPPAPGAAPPSSPAAAPAPAAAGIASAPPQYADSAPAAAAPAAPAAAPAAPAVAPVKKKKKSLITPLVAAAAGLAAVGVAAEVASLASGGKMGKAAPKAGAPEGDGKSEGGEADGEPAPGAEQADKDADSAEDAADTEAPGGEAKAAAADGIIPEGKAGGYVPMKAKAGAPQYQPAISVKFGKLPNKVDLRSLMTPIEDQGETSSCVANAVAGAYEYWIKKASKQDQNISRLFVYYNARWRDGSQDKDDGSVIQLAMEGLQKFGACNEKVWPFDTHLVTKKPGAEAYQDAAPFKVQDMAQVPLKLEAWKQALAEGKPIVFGCLLFDSFDECSKKGGVVPMPAPEDVARKTHSGHSMCAVGYSDSEKVFIVRNSWGADWGDKGYCYMPYSYLMNSKFNDGDCWVFVPKVPAQPPREVWSDDTKPVTNDGNGVDFPIETYTVEQYEALTVDLFERIRKPFNTFVREDFSEYVSFASQSMWSRMESFDFRTFLASTAAIAGVSTALSEFTSESSASEFSSSESVSAMSDETSDEEQDFDEEQDTDEESDEEQDEDEESDDDQDEDEDESDDEESDDDADADEESDDDQDADEDADEDESDDESEDSDDAEAEDDEDSEDGDESDDDGEEADEDESDDADGDEDGDDDESEDGDEESDEDSDDDSDEDDSDEDDGGDDEGDDDDGGDEGGGDDGGDDD